MRETMLAARSEIAGRICAKFKKGSALDGNVWRPKGLWGSRKMLDIQCLCQSQPRLHFRGLSGFLEVGEFDRGRSQIGLEPTCHRDLLIKVHSQGTDEAGKPSKFGDGDQ